MLNPQKPLLVGVSGGPDSLCLMDVLQQLGYRPVVAHLDHGLRPESPSDALFVRQAAEKAGLPFVLGQANAQVYASQNNLSTEEAARTVRYRFLFQQALEHRAQAVAVAHTADDQVETVLMHLLRGAGTTGLAGMAYRSLPTTWSQDIPLVRPFLHVWRAEIEAYLTGRGLQPVQDASNLDQRYFRNRVRHELIPFLEGYNPQMPALLWQMSDVLQQDQALLDELANAAWHKCLRDESPDYVAFEVRQLRDLPASLQRRVLRRAIGRLKPGLGDVDYYDIQRALEFLAAPSRSSQIDLASGLRVLIEGQTLWLAGWNADLPAASWPQVPHNREQSLDFPGQLALLDGWQMSVELVTNTPAGRQQALQNTDPFQAFLDAGRLHFPLTIRPRRPGDSLRPMGMGGRAVKVSDLMINLKLPQRARRDWPLVVSEDEIVWAAGLRITEAACVTDDTRQIVKLVLKKNP